MYINVVALLIGEGGGLCVCVCLRINVFWGGVGWIGIYPLLPPSGFTAIPKPPPPPSHPHHQHTD